MCPVGRLARMARFGRLWGRVYHARCTRETGRGGHATGCASLVPERIDPARAVVSLAVSAPPRPNPPFRPRVGAGILSLRTRDLASDRRAATLVVAIRRHTCDHTGGVRVSDRGSNSRAQRLARARRFCPK